MFGGISVAQYTNDLFHSAAKTQTGHFSFVYRQSQVKEQYCVIIHTPIAKIMINMFYRTDYRVGLYGEPASLLFTTI